MFSRLEETLKDHRHLGVAEIAERVGLSRQRVHVLTTTDPTFPKPVDQLTAGKVWHEADVLTWIDTRRKGRP